eukprot:gene14041-biopygen7427
MQVRSAASGKAPDRHGLGRRGGCRVVDAAISPQCRQAIAAASFATSSIDTASFIFAARLAPSVHQYAQVAHHYQISVVRTLDLRAARAAEAIDNLGAAGSEKGQEEPVHMLLSNGMPLRTPHSLRARASRCSAARQLAQSLSDARAPSLHTMIGPVRDANEWCPWFPQPYTLHLLYVLAFTLETSPHTLKCELPLCYHRRNGGSPFPYVHSRGARRRRCARLPVQRRRNDIVVTSAPRRDPLVFAQTFYCGSR